MNYDNMTEYERQDYEDFKKIGKNYADIDNFLAVRELTIKEED